MAKKIIKRRAHHRKGYIRKNGIKIPPAFVRKTKYEIKNKKPKKVLIAHDNKLGYQTTKAHKLGESINELKEFETIIDKDYWKPGEITSSYETDKREKEMVKEADIIARHVPAPSKTGQKRKEGAQREVKKAINAGKPVIELYDQGGKNSPNRPIREKNYSKRIPIRVKKGETLIKAFQRGCEELKKEEWFEE